MDTITTTVSFDRETYRRLRHQAVDEDSDARAVIRKAIDETSGSTGVADVVKARLAEKAKPATIQRELACLRRALRLGFQAGEVFRVPPLAVGVNNAREVFLSEKSDELEALLKELPDDWVPPLVTLAYWIGFRRGELLKFEWRRVDLDNGTVRLGVEPTKIRTAASSTSRRPRLSRPSTRRASARHRRARTDEDLHMARVFHRGGQPIPVRNFPYEVWHAARERAKLPIECMTSAARWHATIGAAARPRASS